MKTSTMEIPPCSCGAKNARTKIGTGGSSGHNYLKMAVENNRVYEDLFNLSTFLLSKRKELPILPEKLKKSFDFNFQS